MQQTHGYLFKPSTYETNLKPNAIVITTNGAVKKSGEAVMGRGCAKQAADKWPHIPKKLGALIRKNGNIAQVVDQVSLGNTSMSLVSFPVKPIVNKCEQNRQNVVSHMQNSFQPGDLVPGWACKADISIILKSAQQLVQLANEHSWSIIVLPRPGTGYGELAWEQVYPELNKILDDRFYAMTNEYTEQVENAISLCFQLYKFSCSNCATAFYIKTGKDIPLNKVRCPLCNQDT